MGQNPLSAMTKNFVPQVGQMRTSCCTDLGSLLRSSSASPESVFTASIVLRRRSAHRRARGSLPSISAGSETVRAPLAHRSQVLPT